MKKWVLSICFVCFTFVGFETFAEKDEYTISNDIETAFENKTEVDFSQMKELFDVGANAKNNSSDYYWTLYQTLNEAGLNLVQMGISDGCKCCSLPCCVSLGIVAFAKKLLPFLEVQAGDIQNNVGSDDFLMW